MIDMRESFEAWHKSKYKGYQYIWSDRDGEGYYLDVKVDLDWDIWQAALQSSKVEPAPSNMDMRTLADSVHDEIIGRRAGRSEGGDLWLEIGKCARQAKDKILSHTSPALVATTEGVINLSNYINAARINGSDAPHKVIDKLQKAIGSPAPTQEHRVEAKDCKWLDEHGQTCYGPMNGLEPKNAIPLYDHPPQATKMAQEIDWDAALKVSELPQVDEAIRNFLEDSTEDNAVCLVRLIAQFTSPQPAIKRERLRKAVRVAQETNGVTIYGCDLAVDVILSELNQAPEQGG